MGGVITNWGVAIYTSLAAALGLAFAFIPKLIGFLVILLIGWLVGKGLEKAVTYLLRRLGFDHFSERIGLTRLEQRMGMRMDTAGLLGRIVFWFIFLIFLVPAVDALGLTTISDLLDRVISYIPNVFVAILVLFLGALAANFLADIVRGVMANSRIGNPAVFANITRYSILGFVALIALEQLQIAPSLLNILFTAIIGAVALAFGLAFGLSFGLGGRETAQRWLARSESSLNTPTTNYTAPQAVNAATQSRGINGVEANQFKTR